MTKSYIYIDMFANNCICVVGGCTNVNEADEQFKRSRGKDVKTMPNVACFVDRKSFENWCKRTEPIRRAKKK